MKNILFLLPLLFLLACDKSELEMEFPYEGDGTQIEIYLLKTEKASEHAWGDEIKKGDLQETAWLAHDEIEFYDWSSHIFYLKNERKTASPVHIFALCADKEPFLKGYFQPLASSSLPPFPSILEDGSWMSPSDVIGLHNYHVPPDEEMNHKLLKLRTEMERSGLLKEGIEMELLRVRRVSPSSLKYTFKVTNLDKENIYLMDPNRMGFSRFHYFTNGVSLRADQIRYSVTNYDVEEIKEVKQEWYYKLSPGMSMTRTVTLAGFSSLPKGNVIAAFNFPGYPYYFKNTKWEKTDGRIWLGNFRVQKELDLN